MKSYITIVALLFASVFVSAQDDLLNELEQGSKEQKFEQPAFKAMKIGNLQSTKIAAKGDLYLYVSHRFGSLEDGLSTFFGFDNANTKIQLVYGLFDGVQIGASRESVRKTYAMSAKAKIKNQSDNFPVNLAVYGTVNINSELRKDRYPFLKFADRLSYASQLLISRRITNSLSLELAPTFVRQNLVLEPFQDHNQIALGAGGRMKVSTRMSINLDYVYNFSRHEDSIYKNPLTIGLDIETGGHVFQMHFSNAQAMNTNTFLGQATGDWSDGNIYFGFNLSRTF